MKKLLIIMILSLANLIIVSQTIDLQDVIRKAESGNANEQCRLGLYYQNGIGGVLKDPQKSVYWYQKSAAQGVLMAESQLAELYYHGIGVSMNKPLALYYYVVCAEKGFADAQYKAGMMMVQGEGLESPNKERGAFWIKQAFNNKDEEIKKKANLFWTIHELWKY